MEVGKTQEEEVEVEEEVVEEAHSHPHHNGRIEGVWVEEEQGQVIQYFDTPLSWPVMHAL